jgi:mannose-6-phosphate isomerase-like protein (cupin superfamily)
MQRKKIINPIIKDTVIFQTTCGESNGRITKCELELYPGGANGMHFHTRFSETFTAVDGKLMLKLGKKKSLLLNPGEQFTVEPYQPHCFCNPGNQKIAFNIEITPGDAGFERFIHILYKMAANGETDKKGLPKDLKILSLVMAMGDVHAVGWMKVLNPLAAYLSAKGYEEGLDKKLIRKYCTEDYLCCQEAIAV